MGGNIILSFYTVHGHVPFETFNHQLKDILYDCSTKSASPQLSRYEYRAAQDSVSCNDWSGMSNFDPNAILRGAQLTIVGGSRNPLQDHHQS